MRPTGDSVGPVRAGGALGPSLRSIRPGESLPALPGLLKSGGARSGSLLVIAAAALFGTVGTARVLGPEAPSASVGAVRLMIAAALLLLLAAPYGWASVVAAGHLPAVWVAGAAQAAFNLTFLAAVTRTGVAVGTLVAIGCAPILTGLATRQLTAAWLAATGLALGGLVALLSEGLRSGVAMSGVAFAFGASVSYAAFILSSAKLASSPVAMTAKLAAVFTIAAAVLAPALVLSSLEWSRTPSGLAVAVYLAVAATVLAYSLFNRGLRTVAPGSAATLGLTEPLVAALLGVVVLHEHLSPLSWIGASAVLLALAVMVRTSRPTPITGLPA